MTGEQDPNILAVAIRNAFPDLDEVHRVWGSGQVQAEITGRDGGLDYARRVAQKLPQGDWDGIRHTDVWIEGPDGERVT